MAKITSWLRVHWLALALALLVSFIYGSHHFFVQQELARQGKTYYPVTLSFRDEALYAARAQAASGGELAGGDISIVENRTSPALLPILPPLLLGGLGKLWGSLKRALIFSDFLFPALIFLNLYFLALELTGQKFLANFFSVLFIFTPKIFLTIPPVWPSLVRDFFQALDPDTENLLYFSRFEYPKLTFLFFALAFYFTLRALRRREGYAALAAGLFFGLLFYTYLYDWVYFLIGLVLMAVLFLFQKNYWAAKRLFLIALIGLLISSFYWVNFFKLRSLEHYPELTGRLGIEIGNDFRLATAWKTYLRSAALLLLIWLLWRRREPIVASYLMGFLPVIAAVLNLQVILGFNPQPDHWHRTQFLIVALSFLVLSLWLYERLHLERYRSIFTRFGAGVIIFIALTTLSSQYRLSAAHADWFTVSEEYARSYEWLTANTPQWSVIGSLTPPTLTELLMYTRNKVFLPNGFNTTITNDQIWERLMFLSFIFGLNEDQFAAFAQENLLYLFHDYYRDRSFDSYFREVDRELPKEILEEKTAVYARYLKQGFTAPPYRLDYLYFGPRESALGRDPRLIWPDLKTVYDQDQIRIYQLLDS